MDPQLIQQVILNTAQIQQKQLYHHEGLAYHTAQLAQHMRRLSEASSNALARYNVSSGGLRIDTASSSSSSVSSGPSSGTYPISTSTPSLYMDPSPQLSMTQPQHIIRQPSVSTASPISYSTQSDWNEFIQTPIMPYMDNNSFDGTSSGSGSRSGMEGGSKSKIQSQPSYHLDWTGQTSIWKETGYQPYLPVFENLDMNQETTFQQPQFQSLDTSAPFVPAFGYSYPNNVNDTKDSNHIDPSSVSQSKVNQNQSIDPQYLNLGSSHLSWSGNASILGDTFPNYSFEAVQPHSHTQSLSPPTRSTSIAASASPPTPPTPISPISPIPALSHQTNYRRYSDPYTPSTSHSIPIAHSQSPELNRKKSRKRKSTSTDSGDASGSAEWENVADKKERRKLQNRLAQRAFRARTKVLQQQ